MPAANLGPAKAGLVDLEDLEDIDPQTRRLITAIDKIEELSLKLAADRDEMAARLSAAAMFARFAVASAEAALNEFDHTIPQHRRCTVHDCIVDALAHLRTLQAVLAGTPPEREARSRTRSKH